MAEPIPTEDQAEMYVLGELSPRESAAFETKLAESSELAATVRELEEGTIALATASPIKTAPQLVWTKIEDEIAEGAKASKIISVFFGAIRNGWAAAAVVLIGWMIHALYINRAPHTAPQPESVSVAAAETASPNTNISPGTNNLAAATPSQRDRETTILSNQLVGLQRQVLLLSQSVTQQQALLNDSSRIKFQHLVPVNTTQPAGARGLSPAVQRALFLAMARELGWVTSTNESTGTPSLDLQVAPGASNQFNVEFVDLRPKDEETKPAPASTAQTKTTQVASKAEGTATSEAPIAAVIPAFASGDNFYVALDNTAAPAGSEVIFQNYAGTPLGSATIGEGIAVVTLSSASVSGGLIVQFVSQDGQTATYQYVTAP